MKNNEILILEQELPKLDVANMNRYFNYAVQETIERATAKAATIRKVIAPKPDFEEYQSELSKLQVKYSDKDSNGDPITVITQEGDRKMERYSIPDIENPKGKFNVAVEKLIEKHKPAIDAYNEGLQFLGEENEDFEPMRVSVENIPDGLSRKEMSIVFLIAKKEKAE